MIEKIKEKWDEILLHIKEEHELTDVSFKTWLLPTQPYSMKDGTLQILVPDVQFLGYIKKKYGLLIQITIEELTGIECEVDFVTIEQVDEPQKETDKSHLINRPSEVSRQLIQDANLNPRYTFDTFVVGANNNLAHAASLAVAESPGEIYNPLFIYGGVGLGKTHLMHSIGHFILKNNPKAKVLYVTSEKFTNELIDAIRNKNNISTTVLSRLFDLAEPIDTTAGKRAFACLAQSQLDAAHPGRYNQAIMDFGAIQCTPASPRCEACPLSESCLALAAGTVADRPVKRGKTRVRDRWFNYLHVASGDRVLLHRREGRDIWQGLYEFPLIETDAPVEFPDLAALPQFRRLLGDGPWHLVRSVSLPRHQLSHQRLHAVVHRIETPAFTPAAAAMAVPADSLGDYAVPRLVDRYLMQAGSDDSSF